MGLFSKSSKTREQRASDLPKQQPIDESPIDSNLAELQRIQSELQTEERAPKKKISLWTRIKNFFHFNRKFKSGDMTTGANKQRENEYYENFLLAKIGYQQAGISAYAADPGESIGFAATAGAADTMAADISAEAISRTRSENGDNIEAQTDVIYKNKLKLISAKANFKHRILGDSTAEYSSQKTQLQFMGEYRDLTLSGGEFKILHSYNDNTDKFGEIVGMDFTDGTLSVSMKNFLLRDGIDAPQMIFKGNTALLSSDGCTAELQDIMSDYPAIKSGSVLLTTPSDVLGKGSSFNLDGTLTLSDEGIIGENLSQSVGDVKTGSFSGSGASVGLVTESDTRTIRTNVHFDKWEYGFNSGIIEVDKHGENGDASVDAAGVVRLVCPNDIPFYFKIFGKEFPLVPKTDTSSIVISDNALDLEFSSENLTLLGQSFQGVLIKVSHGSTASAVSFSARSMGNPDGKVSITNLNGEIGSNGLLANSAHIHIDPAANIPSIGSLDADITNLSLSKEGLSFDSVNFDAKNITFGEDEMLKMENVIFTASKPKTAPFSVKADMSNVELNISPDEDESGFSIETKGGEGSDGFMASISIEQPLNTAGVNTSKLVANIKTMGLIVGHYDELMNFWLSDFTIGSDSEGMAITANKVNVTAFPPSGEISLFGGFIKFSEFTASANMLKLNKHGIVPETGSELLVNVEDLVFADKKIGGVGIEMSGRNFTVKMTDILKDAVIELGGAQLVFNGGLGLRYNAEKTPKIGAALDELKAKLIFDSTTIELEELSEEEDGSFKLGRAAGIFGVPFTDKQFTAEGRNISFNPATRKLSFERIGGGLANTSIAIGDLEIKSPKLWLLNNFTGFGLSGECGIKLGDVLDASGEICVDMLKEKGYIPTLGPMNNVKVSIPNFGAVSVKTITPNKENPKSFHFEEIALNDGEELKTNEPDDDDSLFKKIVFSLPKPKVTLDEGDWINGKFVYDKSHLHYSASSFEYKPFDGLKLTLDLANKKAAAEYSLTKPDGDWAKKDDLPQLFSMGIKYPLLAFLSVGGGVAGGAGVKLTAKGSIGFDKDEAVLDGSFSFDKAKAYLGLQAYLLIGLPSIANIKIGIEGDLVGDASDSNVQFSMGLKKNTAKDVKMPIMIDNAADKTFFSYNLAAKLTAQLKAFVQPTILGFFDKKRFSINLKTINLATAEFAGKASRANNKWEFEKTKNSITSDLNKDIFDNIIQAKIDAQEAALREIRDIVSDGTAVLGLEGRSREEIFELSSGYVGRIFPQLEKIRDKNKEAFDTLKTADKNALSSLLKDREFIAKHETRLAEAEMVTAELSDEERSVYDNIAAKKDGNSNILGEDLQKLGILPPARVLAELSKRMKILFSLRGITKVGYDEMMSKYVGIRNMLADAAANPFIENNGSYISVNQSSKGSAKTAEAEYKKGAADASGQSKVSDADMKSLIENAKINWKKVKEETQKFNKIGDNISKLSSQLKDKSSDKMNEWLQIESMNNEQIKQKYGQNMSKNMLKKQITEETGITQEDVNSYTKLNKLLKEKAEVGSALEQARKAIDFSKADVTMSFDEEAFNSLRGSLAEKLNSLTELKAKDARRLKDFSIDDVLASHDESYVYCVNDLKKKYDKYVITNKSYVSRDELKQLSANAIKINADENVARYKSLIEGAGKREAEKSGQISDTFMEYLFSEHAASEVKKSAENQSTATPGSTGTSSAEQLRGLIGYTEGRIGVYRKKMQDVHDAIAKTEDNIRTAKSLMRQAVDTFNKLNQITPEDFQAQQSGDAADFKMPGNFKASLNTLVDTQDVAATDLSEEKLNSLDKAAVDAGIKAKSASAAINALQNEDEQTA